MPCLRTAAEKGEIMRVLIASHYLGGLTGSETFWYTVADHLIRLGADVQCWAEKWGRRTGELMALGVHGPQAADSMGGCGFDVALVSHGLVAEKVSERFPGLPMFYFCHGPLPALERPPGESVNIRGYFAVSLETAAFLQDLGVPGEKIHGPFQPVDSEKFCPGCYDDSGWSRVTVVSNRMPDDQVNVVRAACAGRDWSVRFVGERFYVAGQGEVAARMASSAVVVSLGRGVIEGMMCGAVPIVYDYQGCDGVVTLERFDELAECNFSGRVHKEKCSAASLAIWMQIALQTSARELRKMAVHRYDAADLVEQLWRTIEEEV